MAEETTKSSSKGCIILLLLIAGCIWLVGKCGCSSDDDSSNSDQTEQVEESGSSSENDSESGSEVNFNTAQDVLAYLSGKQFDAAGETMEIRQDGIYIDGEPFSGAVSISAVAGAGAVIEAVDVKYHQQIKYFLNANEGTLSDEYDNVYRVK